MSSLRGAGVDDNSLEYVLRLFGLSVLDIVSKVELAGEGQLRMDLDFFAFSGVKDDPLQIEDHDLRQGVKECPLGDTLDLLLAILTSVAVNLLLPVELLETVSQGGLLLDLQHAIIVRLYLVEPVLACPALILAQCLDLTQLLQLL